MWGRDEHTDGIMISTYFGQPRCTKWLIFFYSTHLNLHMCVHISIGPYFKFL